MNVFTLKYIILQKYNLQEMLMRCKKAPMQGGKSEAVFYRYSWP